METGDYSEIKRGTSEYGWLKRHKDTKNNNRYKSYPIASIMWNELLEWRKQDRDPISIPPKLQKAHKTGDYSGIKSNMSEYYWIQAHRKEGKHGRGRRYPIADIIWEEYQKWRKEKPILIPPKLQKAYETGDYSGLQTRSYEYAWIILHKKKNKECERLYTYYPIADVIWEKYQKWRKEKPILIPSKLQKAHETGDYSGIKCKTAEYKWLTAHRDIGKYIHYPIADIMWNELLEWRKKNKK